VSTPGANLNYNGIMTQSSLTNVFFLGPGAGSAPSTLTLANNNTYSGATNVSNNAILAIPTIANSGQPSPLGLDIVIQGISLGTTDSRGTLLLTGTSATYSSNRKATLNGLYYGSGGGAFGVQNAATSLTLGGRMTGSGTLIKTGDGTILLSNISNNYAGGTYVEGGRLDVSNDAALGSSEVRIFSNGILRYTASATVGRSIILDGGVLEAPGDVSLAAAGAIQGEGTVVGNVANSGSVVPEGSTGLLHIEGNYTQTSSGILIMFADLFLPPGSNSRLEVTGDVALDGTLQMNLGGMGQFRGTRSFDVLDWTGNLTGTFSSLQLPMFGGAFSWDTSQLYNSGVLTLTGPPLEGEYNNNGKVDAADYVVWRKGFGTTYTQNDYDIWRAHFGQTSGGSYGSGAGVNTAVPEPAASLMLLFATAGWCLRRRRSV
jgi:autotransporter-associated beta strand protein